MMQTGLVFTAKEVSGLLLKLIKASTVSWEEGQSQEVGPQRPYSQGGGVNVSSVLPIPSHYPTLVGSDSAWPLRAPPSLS